MSRSLFLLDRNTMEMPRKDSYCEVYVTAIEPQKVDAADGEGQSCKRTVLKYAPMPWNGSKRGHFGPMSWPMPELDDEQKAVQSSNEDQAAQRSPKKGKNSTEIATDK